jgi:hypothetical protein
MSRWTCLILLAALGGGPAHADFRQIDLTIFGMD